MFCVGEKHHSQLAKDKGSALLISCSLKGDARLARSVNKDVRSLMPGKEQGDLRGIVCAMLPVFVCLSARGGSTRDESQILSGAGNGHNGKPAS